MSWIKGINNLSNSAGLTFEALLDKKPDSIYFPDYKGLEIKTTTRYSRYPFSLFSIAFDGPDFYETNRILQNYGRKDYIFKNKKMLTGYINSNNPVLLSNYYFKINLDSIENKLYLKIYDNNLNFIEKTSYINFDTITNRIKLKLNNLAIVYASKKKIENNLYFRYYAYKIYKIKDDFDIVYLINNNILKIKIECRISRSGNDIGRQKNKALLFQLDKNNIDKIFDLVEECNFDEINKNFSIFYM